MRIEEQLKQEILSKYKSVRAFTTAINIPYTTLDSVFKRGITNAGVSTMIRIFDALDLDIESIQDDCLRHRQFNKDNPSCSDAEVALLKKYRLLDQCGKEAIDGVLEVESRRCANIPLQIPLITARTLLQDEGVIFQPSDTEILLLRSNEWTRQAKFAIRVNGNSCEWWDDDILLFSKSESPKDYGFGLYFLGGKYYLKEKVDDELHFLYPNNDKDIIKITDDIQCEGVYIETLFPDWVADGQNVFPEKYPGPCNGTHRNPE